MAYDEGKDEGGQFFKGKGRTSWSQIERINKFPLRFLKWSFRWLFAILILLILIVGAVLLFSAWSDGSLDSSLAKLGIIVGESAVGKNVKGGALSLFDIIRNPSKLQTQYSWESEVIENRDNPDLGVFLETMTLNNPSGTYNENSRILANVRVKVNSLSETTNIKVGCKLQDYKKEPFVIGPRKDDQPLQGEYDFTVYKDQSTILNVGCQFPDGVNFDDFDEGIEITDDKIRTKKLTLKATYDFTTRAFLELWYMDENTLSQLYKENKDPFENINVPLKNSDDTMRSEYTQGPMELGLGSSNSQPFKGDFWYDVGVSLVPVGFNTAGIRGDVSSFNLHVPPSVILNDQFCDFSSTGQSTEDAYEIYALKPDLLAEANIKCEGLGAFSNECLEKLNAGLSYNCEFKVLNVQPAEQPEFTTLRAEASYQFETTKSKAITIQKAL